MKLQRTTLILVLVALGLGGFVYFYEIQAAPQREAAKTKAQKIFDFEKDQIQAFTIKNSTETLRFERVNQKADEKSKISSWQMTEPIKSPASDPSVSYLLDLLVQGKNNRTITVPVSQISDYGMDKPFSTVQITLKNQKTPQLILGKPDFNRSFLYAQIDSPPNQPQTLQLALIPIDFEYAVTRPLSEWQAKDEKPKQEPVNSETVSPSPSPTDSQSEESDKKPPTKSETVSPSSSPTDSQSEESDKKPPTKLETASPLPSPTNSQSEEFDKKPPAKSETASPSPSP